MDDTGNRPALVPRTPGSLTRAPVEPHRHIERPAAIEAAREGLSAGLLRVLAPAGYGKTALLARAVGDDSRPVAWTTGLGPGGSTPIAALAASLGVPCAGARARGSRSHSQEHARALAARFCGTLERAGLAGSVVVIDDVHELDGDGLAELSALAEHVPHGVRIAVAGRWQVAGGLGSARPEAITLGPDVLTLSVDECRELCRRTGRDVSDDEADQLAHLSEGWITGVLLSMRPGGDPADYLLREVIGRLPGAVGDLLEDLRLLDRFTPEMAVAVTDRGDAADLLATAVARGGFVLGCEGGGRRWLRLHRMLRGALDRRAATRPPERRVRVHRSAADAFAAIGLPEEAARHHAAAGDLERAVGALTPLAGGDGGGGPVGELLANVPARAWSDAPGRVLAMASHLFYRADHQRAFESMRLAAQDLADSGDLPRARVVMVRLLRAAPLAGGLYGRTIAAAQEILPALGTDPVLTPASLTMLGLMLAETGDYEGAETELDRAAHEAAGDPLCEARIAATRAFAIDFPQGRPTAALAALDEAIELLEERQGDDPLNYLLYVRAFRSLLLADMGRFVEALDESSRFDRTAAGQGLGRLGRPVSGMLRLVPLAGLGRWDDLGSEIARGSPGARRLGGALRSYRYEVARARLAAAEGDRDRVVEAVASARSRLDEHGLPYDAAMTLADLARSALAVGDDGLAQELAADAHAAAALVRSPWGLLRASIAVATSLGATSEGDRALADALRRSADGRHDEHWAACEREAAAVLLPRARERGVGDAAVVERLSRACGGDLAAAVTSRHAVATPVDESPLRSATSASAVVHFVTLGGFSVERSGITVEEAQFGRRKARTLLAVLLCARRAVHREELADVLWPDLPAQRGRAALHSTLHTLRRTLEPELAQGDTSSIIVAEGEGYRVALGPHATWDADIFLQASQRARLVPPALRLEALMRAESLYRGPLLPEWPYAEWARPLSTEIEEAHRQVLENLAELHSAAGRHSDAIARYRLLLAIEPEREGWHRALMSAYIAAGERALALRQFHACRRMMVEELGVEPSDETRELHLRILRGD